MYDDKVCNWSEIEKDFTDTLLLGNGASIAINNNFLYESLCDYAFKEDVEIKKIFDFLDTNDFELVLRILWYTDQVCKKTNFLKNGCYEGKPFYDAYRKVQQKLIDSVRSLHNHFCDIKNNDNIYVFLSKFKTIFSLNYDLNLYWAIMRGNEKLKEHKFKDCFVEGNFSDDWKNFRNPIREEKTTSLFFYPHGNLSLCRDRFKGIEKKISKNFPHNNNDPSLLENIFNSWTNGLLPLFVSEGESSQKLSSIKSSYYLSVVYREILPEQKDSLVIYGWGIAENDAHILEALKKTSAKKIAISVFQNNRKYMIHARSMIEKYLGEDIEINFFDSQSAGCWNNSPEDKKSPDIYSLFQG